MKLTASSIDFTNLLHLDSIVNNLQPDIKLENLNSYLYYNKRENKLYLFIKGSIAYAAIDIDATIDADEDIGLMIYSGNITHLVSNYTEEMRNKIKMTIDLSKEKSVFSFTGNNDKINFAHLALTEAELQEVAILTSSLPFPHYQKGEIPIFDFNLTGDSRQFFLNGIDNCLDFIDDDLKNNAIAIYPHKLLASDNRHVYQYGLIDNLPINNPVFIHKKIAKIILDLDNKKGNPLFILFSNNRIQITSVPYKFRAIINNNLANIAPPDEEDLKGLRPNTIMSVVNKVFFDEFLDFFMGFYSTKVNYKTITVESLENALNFTLKNSGVVGYNSNHVERQFETATNGSGVSCVLLIDSIRNFIKHLTKEDSITMLMDSEHKAVVLQSNRQELYLAKLKDK